MRRRLRDLPSRVGVHFLVATCLFPEVQEPEQPSKRSGCNPASSLVTSGDPGADRASGFCRTGVPSRCCDGRCTAEECGNHRDRSRPSRALKGRPASFQDRNGLALLDDLGGALLQEPGVVTDQHVFLSPRLSTKKSRTSSRTLSAFRSALPRGLRIRIGYASPARFAGDQPFLRSNGAISPAMY